MPADSDFLQSLCAANLGFCGTASLLNLEKNSSRASQGAAHLAPFPQMPDSDFFGRVFCRKQYVYSISCFPESESALLIPGCHRRATDSDFRTPELSQNVVKRGAMQRWELFFVRVVVADDSDFSWSPTRRSWLLGHGPTCELQATVHTMREAFSGLLRGSETCCLYLCCTSVAACVPERVSISSHAHWPEAKGCAGVWSRCAAIAKELWNAGANQRHSRVRPAMPPAPLAEGTP